jgi:DNA polymerase-3 subunit delta'
MAIRPIYGHDPLRARITAAQASGRFPQATLLVGPRGVGKQRLALWTAQAFLCEADAGPCGTCIPCRQVQAVGHPDLHWFMPIERPKAADTDKQVEEARALLAADAAARADTGLWTAPEGRVSYPLASMHLLQRIVSRTPFTARRKIIVLGHAEWLVVQEASQEAANALLKVLEEPPADTTILVTAERPQALLPTIRSRLVPLRVPALPDSDVQAFLKQEMGVTGRRIATVSAEARGSIGEAVRRGQAGGSDEHEEAASALLERLERGKGAWVPAALGRASYGARDDFQPMLDALASQIRDRMAAQAHDGNVPALKKAVRALKRVEAVRAETRGNVNPQLAVAVLAGELEGLL